LVIGGDRLFIKTDQVLDTSSQRAELETELQYYIGFMESVDKKLSNERFVQNAKPEIVALENKKKEDALEKIRMIEESIANLN
jgi:valyl-tRNA synthetase